MALEIWRLVETLEISGIKLHSRDSPKEFTFRVEILRLKGKRAFRAQVSRWDSYRILPSFPQKAGRARGPAADCEFAVRDEFMAAQDFSGNSAARVLAQVRKAIGRTFGIR